MYLSIKKVLVINFALVFLLCLSWGFMLNEKAFAQQIVVKNNQSTSEGFYPPKVISSIAPIYSTEALKKGLEGEVSLKLFIGVEGDVKYVQIRISSGYDILDEAAKTSVLKWVFKPACNINGEPISSDVYITIEFSGENNKH